ncbi:MAG: protein-(glutamine-N5) methyltransferase, release factor-specific [Spirochaetes bacterium GWF1_51_8]|nr:MAG: protein-(glutamine-N5) methyltransferase, release factor-specific [Spirochaetes bacterium GWF1_51_8]
MTAGELYHDAIERFARAGIAAPRTDAGILIAHAFGLERIDILADKDREAGFLKKRRALKMIERRLANEPVAYILGYRHFYLDKFIVTPDVLIPRCDTEHIIYTAERYGKQRGGYKRILDIGTGSGAIAVSLARVFPDSAVIGIDVVTRIAEKNVRALGVSNVHILFQDMMELEPAPGTLFDLVVSNPPYLSGGDMKNLAPEVRDYEPDGALYGGLDGLDYYRRIAELLPGLLDSKGMLLLETDYKWREVSEVFMRKGYPTLEIVKDYNGIERVLAIGKTHPNI